MFANLFNTFANCFKIPELKSRIFFTLMVLAICRLLAWVPVPGLDAAALRAHFATSAAQTDNTLVGMYSLFTGGALQRCAIGALVPVRAAGDWRHGGIWRAVYCGSG